MIEEKSAELEPIEPAITELDQDILLLGNLQGLYFSQILIKIPFVKRLAEVKNTGAYESIGTWEQYCQVLGISRAKADNMILDQDVLGENFLSGIAHVGLGSKDFRRIRHLPESVRPIVETDGVIIDGEKIPASPENRDRIQAAIIRLTSEHDKESREAKREIKDNKAEAKHQADQVFKLSRINEDLQLKLGERTQEVEAIATEHCDAIDSINKGLRVLLNTDYSQLVESPDIIGQMTGSLTALITAAGKAQTKMLRAIEEADK